MTDDLTQRAERAIEELRLVTKAAEDFIKGNYFEKRMCLALRDALFECQSPWVDRAGAAARWRCSEAEIDRAAKLGILTRLERSETPLFEKAQGDAAIRDGKWKFPKAKGDKLKTETQKLAA